MYCVARHIGLMRLHLYTRLVRLIYTNIDLSNRRYTILMQVLVDISQSSTDLEDKKFGNIISCKEWVKVL